MAHRMAVVAARVFLVADLHAVGSTAVLGNGIVVGEHIQARFRGRRRELDRSGLGCLKFAVKEMFFEPGPLHLHFFAGGLDVEGRNAFYFKGRR